MSRAMHVSENFERQSLQQEAAKRREQLNLPLPFQDDARFLIERGFLRSPLQNRLLSSSLAHAMLSIQCQNQLKGSAMSVSLPPPFKLSGATPLGWRQRVLEFKIISL